MKTLTAEGVGAAIQELSEQWNRCAPNGDCGCDTCQITQQYAIVIIRRAVREGMPREEVMEEVTDDMRDWAEAVFDHCVTLGG